MKIVFKAFMSFSCLFFSIFILKIGVMYMPENPRINTSIICIEIIFYLMTFLSGKSSWLVNLSKD